MTSNQLRDDALAIWQAGVEAVTPARLFRDKVRLTANTLCMGDVLLELRGVRRVIVVGAGKASAAMALELHRQVLSRLDKEMPSIDVAGWINCPEGTFSEQVPHVFLHAARPAGINAPTIQAVQGTQKILELVSEADQNDVVLCLISGGGSALLVAPTAGITLGDKQAVARQIAAAGGNIEQLNTVRRALSDVKGGGLARASRAGRMISLIISDVIGDPLATIASGPTVTDTQPDAVAALRILEELQLTTEPQLSGVLEYLRTESNQTPESAEPRSSVEHVILGNNTDAVDAAGVKAVELGYRYVMQAAGKPEPDVMQVAEQAAAATTQVASQNQVDCWISGGEPTVRLPKHGAGLGGRNQQLTLAVMDLLAQQGWPEQGQARGLRELTFLSGGTDGEDGPTDAAGAWFDRELWERCRNLGLEPREFLARADAYHFFDQVGGLIRTGPTGTNVCDLRVALAKPAASGH